MTMNKQVCRLGILGGSFDPVHTGHINLARAAADILNLDTVLLEPNRIPYYKKNAAASDEHRFAMVNLAAGLDARFKAGDLELKSDRYLSTEEVLTILREQYQDTAVYFLMGMDSFLYLDTWRNYETIMTKAHVAVCRRPGYTLDLQKISAPLLKLYKEHNTDYRELVLSAELSGGLCFIDTPEFDISSTELRQAVCNRPDIAEKYIPAEVLGYIRVHGLYGAD